MEGGAHLQSKETIFPPGQTKKRHHLVCSLQCREGGERKGRRTFFPPGVFSDDISDDHQQVFVLLRHLGHKHKLYRPNQTNRQWLNPYAFPYPKSWSLKDFTDIDIEQRRVLHSKTSKRCLSVVLQWTLPPRLFIGCIVESFFFPPT